MARTAGIFFCESQVNGSSDLKGLKSLRVEFFKSNRMDMLRTKVWIILPVFYRWEWRWAMSSFAAGTRWRRRWSCRPDRAGRRPVTGSDWWRTRRAASSPIAPLRRLCHRPTTAKCWRSSSDTASPPAAPTTRPSRPSLPTNSWRETLKISLIHVNEQLN